MTTRGVSRKARRVAIQQRAHEGDFSGHVLSTDTSWVHIVLPMRFEPDRMTPTPLGLTDKRTKEGELLAESQFPEPVVAAMEKALGSYGSAGQLQQRPAPREGGMFKRHWFQIVEKCPADARRVRWWDKGATEGDGDPTAGVLMALKDGIYYIEDIKCGQWSVGNRDKIMLQTAELDAEQHRGTVRIWTEQEPGSSGKESAQATVRLLAGYPINYEPSTGQKEVRAEPFAAQAEAGNVRLVKGPWNADFLDEAGSFPNGKHDDMVDAASAALNKLSIPPRVFRQARVEQRRV